MRGPNMKYSSYLHVALLFKAVLYLNAALRHGLHCLEIQPQHLNFNQMEILQLAKIN